MLTFQRCVFCMMILVVVLCAQTQTATAQAPAAPPPANSQPVGRSYAVEGFVVVLLMVGAGAAVCRSSHRS